MTKPFFILGAFDPEMREIESVLQANGLPYAHAIRRGKPVDTRTANQANGLGNPSGGPRDPYTAAFVPKGTDRIVAVECRVWGITPDVIIDHHAEGDPGYGLPPERYLEGSSLGQLLSMLDIEPSYRQRLIAAGDHCLAHAYAGRCPGIDRDDLVDQRVSTRAAYWNTTAAELRRLMKEALKAFQRAERVDVGGVKLPFIDATSDAPPVLELDEASAFYGQDYIMLAWARSSVRRKIRLRSTTVSVIEAFMRECGLERVYGDPYRGFAGGYFPA